MSLRNWIIGAGVVLMTTAGCSMFEPVSFDSRADEVAAERARAQAEAAAQQQASQAQTKTAGKPGTAPTVAQAAPAQRAEVQFEAGEPVSQGTTQKYSANAAAEAMRPLGLYGQIPNVPVAAKSASPLDSPDNIRRVTFATEGADSDPSVDPTGQYLVYSSTQHRQTADLYIKRVDGTTVTQLTNDPSNNVMPVFSPDGKRVAFASDRSGNWDLYMMDIDGGQPVQLTNDATHDLHPSFSPDGKQIVYCSYGTQSGQWELVVIDVDRPATKRFIGYGLFPQWSPVDNRIVFQRARERGTRWFSVWTLEYVNGEGVRPTEIAASSNAAVISPAWSPDGKGIVFCTVVDPAADASTRPGQADIWMVNADGTNRVNLTRNHFANLQPTWAKDGVIYFVSNRTKEGRENVYAIRPDRAMNVARAPSSAGGAITAKAATPGAPGSSGIPGSLACPAAPAIPAAHAPSAMHEKPVEAAAPATPAAPLVSPTPEVIAAPRGTTAEAATAKPLGPVAPIVPVTPVVREAESEVPMLTNGKPAGSAKSHEHDDEHTTPPKDAERMRAREKDAPGSTASVPTDIE